MGSFLNVVIYRVPNKLSVAKPASHCPTCKEKIKWYDNIPILSYILLGGKCRNCKTHIPFRYTAVEILNTLLWLLCGYMFYEKSVIYSVIVMLAISAFLCVFFIDLENMIIPDRFQIIILVLGIAAIFFDYSAYSGREHWLSNIIGGVAAFGVFYLIGLIGGKIAKREALGGGDIKLAGVMGLFLGWQKLLLAMIIASVSACVVILITNIKSKEKGKEYPFAPFLSAGFILTVLFGNGLLDWYFSLLGLV